MLGRIITNKEGHPLDRKKCRTAIVILVVEDVPTVFNRNLLHCKLNAVLIRWLCAL